MRIAYAHVRNTMKVMALKTIKALHSTLKGERGNKMWRVRERERERERIQD